MGSGGGGALPHAALPSHLPVTCASNLGQLLQCLAVYFPTVKTVHPAVREGSGSG